MELARIGVIADAFTGFAELESFRRMRVETHERILPFYDFDRKISLKAC